MDKINLRQTACLVFLLTVAMKTFMLPVLMMRIVGRDAFISMLIYAVCDAILLVVVLTVLKFYDGNFFELLSSVFGKPIAVLLLLCACAVAGIKIFISLVGVKTFFSTSVFTSKITPLHLLPVILLVAYFALKPASTLGRVSEIIAPIVFISMLLLGALTLPEVDFGGLFPLAERGLAPAVDGTYPFSMWFGDYFLLLVMTGRVKRSGKLYFSLIVAVVGMALVTAFATVLFASYGDMIEVLTYGHNISNLTQYGEMSYKFGRLDIIVYSLWTTATLISAGMGALFVMRSATMAFGDKVGKIADVVLAFLLLASFVLFTEENRVLEFVSDYLWIAGACAEYGLPVLSLLALSIDGIKKTVREKHEKETFA